MMNNNKYAEPELDEVYSEYKEKTEETTTKKIQKNLTGKEIMAFGVIILIITFLGFILKKGDGETYLTTREAIFALIGVIILAVILANKSQDPNKMLTIREAKSVLLDEINYMQNVTQELPNGRVKILPGFKLWKIEGKPDKWKGGVEIECYRGLKIIYQTAVDPYIGYLIEFFEVEKGLEIDKQDIKFIRTRQERWNDRYRRRGESSGPY